MNNSRLAVLLAILMILGAYTVVAAPNGATVAEGAQERASATAAGTVSTQGGNVTQVNVTGTQLTSRWTGFFGTINGGYTLEDGSSNLFYEWTISNTTGAIVYAANGTVSTWTLAAANELNMPTNLQGVSAPDTFNNTFSATEAFTSATIGPVANTPYTTTWQGGSQGTQLKTYALTDPDDSDIVFAGYSEYNVTSFKGAADPVDYQILAPGFASGVTYNFYLELP